MIEFYEVCSNIEVYEANNSVKGRLASIGIVYHTSALLGEYFSMDFCNGLGVFYLGDFIVNLSSLIIVPRKDFVEGLFNGKYSIR